MKTKIKGVPSTPQLRKVDKMNEKILKLIEEVGTDGLQDYEETLELISELESRIEEEIERINVSY